MALDLQVRVRTLHILERIDVGHQVPAHPEGVDEFLHAGGLVDRLGDVDRDVACPADRGVGDAQGREDRLVEAALPDQQLVHLLQELPGPGSLDDTVVVGAGERDRLADPEGRERLLAGPLELGGVLQGTGADDRALPAHQAGHRVHGADAARVGQRDRGALEVRGGELVRACAADQILVGGQVLGEAHRVSALDARHEQGPGAVGLGDVDRDAEVHVRGGDRRGLAVDLGVEDVLARELLERLHDRPADEVSEADLAAARACHVVVDDDAVVDHQLGRDRAHARSRGNGERLVHVRREGLRQTPQGGHGVFLAVDGSGIRCLRGRGLRRDGGACCGLCRGARHGLCADDGDRGGHRGRFCAGSGRFGGRGGRDLRGCRR